MLGGFLRRGHQGPAAALHSRGRAVSHTGTWHLPWVAGGCLAPTAEECSPDTLCPPQRIFHNLPAPTPVGAAGPDPTRGHAAAWKVTAGEAGGVAGIQVRSPSPLGAWELPARVTRYLLPTASLGSPEVPKPHSHGGQRGHGALAVMGGWGTGGIPIPTQGQLPSPEHAAGQGRSRVLLGPSAVTSRGMRDTLGAGAEGNVPVPGE